MARFRQEIIGDHRMFLGDARDLLDVVGSVDAVVCDPPYGIGEAAGKNASRSKPFKGAELKMPGKTIEARDYGHDAWDDEPVDDILLARVRCAAKWSVIFGGNYYALPPTSCWLVWDKLNGDSDFADCELAWTNLPKAVRRIRYMWNGMLRANGEERGDHPTQKPVGVMSWCLQQLPAGTRTILDPFAGSGTTGVACVKAGMVFTGIEREERYFDAACRRIAAEVAKPRLFEEPPPKPVQASLLETLD